MIAHRFVGILFSQLCNIGGYLLRGDGADILFSKRVSSVLKFVKDRGLEEDFYIRAIFDNDKTLLYNTLKETFLKWPKEQQEHFAKGFADDDRDDYADWIIEQED